MANVDVGDLVVTSAGGLRPGRRATKLVVGNYRGGHGGLRADQLRVPLRAEPEPGVARDMHLPAARAEDVGATLMALLGLRPEAEADGVLLSAALDPAPANQAR